MTNQSKLKWSTGKVIALCAVVACLAFYGASKSALFVTPKPQLLPNATVPVSNQHLDTETQPKKEDEGLKFVRVARVVDGDVIKLADGTVVDLVGVSCPKMDETDPSRLAIAREALAFTAGAVLEREVRLEYEPEHLVDGSGRTLAYVYLRDGTLLNAELVKRGYGNAFTRYAYRFSQDFRKYEITAKRSKIGLWEDRETEISDTPSEDTYADTIDSVDSANTSSPSTTLSTNSASRPKSPVDNPPAEVRGNDYGSTPQRPVQSYFPAPRQTYSAPSYSPPSIQIPNKPAVGENGSYYGEISERTGRPKTVYVQGYTRRDGTYVRSHFRSAPRR